LWSWVIVVGIDRYLAQASRLGGLTQASVQILLATLSTG